MLLEMVGEGLSLPSEVEKRSGRLVFWEDAYEYMDHLAATVACGAGDGDERFVTGVPGDELRGFMRDEFSGALAALRVVRGHSSTTSNATSSSP